MAFPSMLVLVQWIHAEVLMNPVALPVPANNFKIFIFHLAFIYSAGGFRYLKMYYVLQGRKSLNAKCLLKYF